MTNTNLPSYSRFAMGNWIATTEAVCKDGAVRQITVEQFADGYHVYVTKEDGKYTNHKGYATLQKAINAGTKF